MFLIEENQAQLLKRNKHERQTSATFSVWSANVFQCVHIQGGMHFRNNDIIMLHVDSLSEEFHSVCQIHISLKAAK